MAEKRNYALNGAFGFWRTVTLFLLIEAGGPLFTFREGNIGNVKLFFILGSVAFALAVVRLVIKASDAYAGDPENSRLWRIVGLQAIGGVAALVLGALLYGGDDEMVFENAVLGCCLTGLLQIVTVSVAGVIIPASKPPEPSEPTEQT